MATLVTDLPWHLTAAGMGLMILFLWGIESVDRCRRNRLNLPLLTGWIIALKLLRMAGALWIICYFVWLLCLR